MHVLDSYAPPPPRRGLASNVDGIPSISGWPLATFSRRAFERNDSKKRRHSHEPVDEVKDGRPTMSLASALADATPWRLSMRYLDGSCSTWCRDFPDSNWAGGIETGACLWPFLGRDPPPRERNGGRDPPKGENQPEGGYLAVGSGPVVQRRRMSFEEAFDGHRRRQRGADQLLRHPHHRRDWTNFRCKNNEPPPPPPPPGPEKKTTFPLTVAPSQENMPTKNQGGFASRFQT